MNEKICPGCHNKKESKDEYFCHSCASILNAENRNNNELTPEEIEQYFLELFNYGHFTEEEENKRETELKCSIKGLVSIYTEALIIGGIRKKVIKSHTNPMKLVKGFTSTLEKDSIAPKSSIKPPKASKKVYEEDKAFRITTKDVPFLDSKDLEKPYLVDSYMENSGQMIIQSSRPQTATVRTKKLNSSLNSVAKRNENHSFVMSITGKVMKGASRTVPPKTITLSTSNTHFAKASIPSLVPSISLRKMNDYQKSIHFERYFGKQKGFGALPSAIPKTLARPYSYRPPFGSSSGMDRGVSRQGQRPNSNYKEKLKGLSFKTYPFFEMKTSRIAFVQECAHIVQGRTLASSIRYK